ncbi:MAG: hypothetical protein E7233_01985 [Lachnospiraceae bacterium]|nr:hypothetical protein [Lachnospiraceae bacterium]
MKHLKKEIKLMFPALCPEEKALSYSKYMDLPIDPLPDNILEQINADPLQSDKVLPIERITHFFEHGFEETDFGFRILDDGVGYLAHYLYVPDLDMPKLGWWFGWSGQKPESVPDGCGNIRYKIWCPPDHWDHCPANGVDDSDGTIMEESLDMGSGGPVIRSLVRAIDPREIGVSKELLDEYGEKHQVLQLTHEHSENVTDRIFSAIMRPCPDGGLELRARVWWGYKYEGKKFVRDDDPGKLQCSEKLLRNNLLHSSYEFNHLRKLLHMH